MAVKVVRTNGHDEIVARTNNLLVGRPAFETARRLYPHGRVDYHAVRPGFRITELQIAPTQKVPWHYHNNVHDTFLCGGRIDPHLSARP
jgi:quercetin dioxygenase-like cupin family protein